ncbi:hypothetical protein KFK09_009948 [Dendrobium nobile]|uniref:Uncharacterized protein n=1 Tax=Dendrobium nobile TaxID=94219 RepID=A0A8T3BP14_DENNO|nr:hypothetical protein KFK09_009948 [Dendrobium nobile]
MEFQRDLCLRVQTRYTIDQILEDEGNRRFLHDLILRFFAFISPPLTSSLHLLLLSWLRMLYFQRMLKTFARGHRQRYTL